MHDRAYSRLRHPRHPCRRAARSDHRRAGDADLSDDVVRLQRRRPRRFAVRPAGVRQHLYAHRQSDQRRAGRTRCGARRRHGGAGGGLRARSAGDRVSGADAARRRIHRRAKALWRLDQPVQPRLQEFWLEGGLGRRRRYRQLRARGHAEDQGDLHRIRSPIPAAPSPTSRRSPPSPARPACR